VNVNLDNYILHFWRAFNNKINTIWTEPSPEERGWTQFNCALAVYK